MKSSIKRYLVYLFFLTFCFFFSASYVSALNIRVGSKVLGNTQAKGATAPNRSNGATLNGADAYCVSPGKDMSSRISYTIDTEFFDLSNCQTAKGGVPSYACGVAIMMLKSYEKGYDYNTNLLALRIWSAFKSFDGDGEWHEEEKTPIYRLTADAILHGYNGTLNPSEVNTGVIYAINNKGLQEIKDAIGLFRDAHSNNYNYFTVKTNSSQIVDIDKEGNVEFTIKTNFESPYTKNVKIVSLDSNVALSIKSSGPCDDPTYKTCYVMTGKINGFNKKNCNTSRINYKITYQDSRDMLGAVSLIVPTNYTYYQRFVVFDSSAITTRQITGAVATTCPEIFQCKISTVVEEITDDCSQGTTWTKADPTIDCIINTDKLVADYDFSNKYVHDSSNSSAKVTNGNTTTTVNQTFYSVNTYCTIACRETVSYNLFDKETADSTKFFKYQNGVYNGNYLIATITGDRECATDIKYTAWKNAYKSADELVRTTWNTYKYYENLHVYTDPVSSVLSCSYTGGCSTCGCHCCDTTCPDGKGGSEPCCKGNSCGCYTGCSSSCSWSGTKLTWPSKPYGFTNANGSISTPTSSGEDGSKSCGGSNCGEWSSCTGASGNANKYSSNYTTAKAAYENAVKKREELIGFIQDCNMYDKFSLNEHMTSGYTRNDKVSLYYEVTDGYDFNPEFSSFSYDSNYSNMIDLDYKTVLTNKTNATYCVGCDESKDFGATRTENLKYWVCTGAETGAKCTARDIAIPTNTRAFVTAQKQRYMWQDAEFYSTVPTGEMAATKKDNSIKISDYNVFPLEIGKLSGDYGVSTTVVKVGDADRKSVTKFANESYSCEFTVPNKITIYDDTTTGGIGGYGFYYRTIDVDNVFPTGVKTGVWNTSTAKSLVKGIQEKGEEIYLETPAYEFILTPSNMRNIKSYNRQMDSTSSVFGGTLGYNDFNLTCNSNGDCVSNFLKSISRGGNLSDLVTSYKKDGVTQ